MGTKSSPNCGKQNRCMYVHISGDVIFGSPQGRWSGAIPRKALRRRPTTSEDDDDDDDGDIYCAHAIRKVRPFPSLPSLPPLSSPLSQSPKKCLQFVAPYPLYLYPVVCKLSCEGCKNKFGPRFCPVWAQAQNRINQKG